MTKKDYMRKRRIALKRMDRLAKAGLSKTLVGNYGHGAAFPTYTSMAGNARDFMRAARRLEAFLSAKTSTVSGARRSRDKISKMVKDYGVDIPKSKIDTFGEFMRDAKAAASDRAFDSERAVKAFAISEKNNFDKDYIAKNFDKWVEKNIDRKIERRKKQVTSDDINSMIGGVTNESDTGRKLDRRTDRRNGARSGAGRSTGKQKKKK